MSDVIAAKLTPLQQPPGEAERATARQSRAVGEPGLLSMLSLADWVRFIPETLGLLAVITAIEYGLGYAATAGSTSNLPHAYWIPVLLVSAQYGVMAGMFSATAAIICYVSLKMPPQSAAQSVYDFAGQVAAQPAAWAVSALVLGGLRSLQIHHQALVEEQLAAAQQTASDLADVVERAASEIGAIERHVAGETGSVSAILRALALLDLGEPGTTAAGFLPVVRSAVRSATVVVYLREGATFRPVAAMEDDCVTPAAALASLDIARGRAFLRLSDGEVEAAGTAAGAWSLAAAVGGKEAEAALGLICCHGVAADVDRVHARRRLEHVAAALAAMLAVHRDPKVEASA